MHPLRKQKGFIIYLISAFRFFQVFHYRYFLSCFFFSEGPEESTTHSDGPLEAEDDASSEYVQRTPGIFSSFYISVMCTHFFL